MKYVQSKHAAMRARETVTTCDKCVPVCEICIYGHCNIDTHVAVHIHTQSL